MKRKISKTEAKEKISKFFEKIKDKKPNEVWKIRKLAMKQKIQLKTEKKLFCKKCLVPYLGTEKIRIKSGYKTITCENCGQIKRIKIIN